MLRQCCVRVRNGLERGGMIRDAAGYRLQIVPGGYEVRARFRWEFRTDRRGFDCRRFHPGKPSNLKGLLGFSWKRTAVGWRSGIRR
jgi:hypothetical protein